MSVVISDSIKYIGVDDTNINKNEKQNVVKAKNKKEAIKSGATDTPLYILMIVNFLLVPNIMFNVTITIINLVNILLDTFRFIRNPLNNKSLLINVTINISYILLSFLLLGVCIQKSVKIVATGGNLLL